jgi:aryl-phospho-beta-D-glucosidase BglC (GH1 family)
MRNDFNKKCLICLILVFNIAFVVKAQMTPQQAILKMTCGINVGNSLELTTEGSSGGRYIQEYYFTDFKAAGFNLVRIPIRWDLHTLTTAPYTIDSVWLKRVEQVVDWSLKHGLITIINSHHDDWILNDNSYTTTDLVRFDSIWSQVATRFRKKSDSLMFEIANEPNIGISLVDKINASIIPIIRKTNPTRIIVFGSSGTQMSTLKKAVIPVDKYLIASFHTYEPWAFAGEGTGTWGTTTEVNVVKAMIKDAAAWSTTNKIPLLMGEFGTISKCEANSRMKWFYTHLEEARRYNIAPAVWQDFGNFSVYYNTTTTANKWNNSIKEIIVFTNPLSVESLTINVDSTLRTSLSWKNRATDYKWIRIERKEGSGAYSSLISLSGKDTTFVDASAILGKTYTYRIITELSTGVVTYCYPVDKKIALTTSVNNLNTYNNKNFMAYFKNEDLILKKDNNQQLFFFNVFSMSGKAIKSGSFQTEEYIINTSSLSKGFYFINLINIKGQASTTMAIKY